MAEVFPAKENIVWFLLAGLSGSVLFHISIWAMKKSIVALKPYMYLFARGTARKFNTESLNTPNLNLIKLNENQQFIRKTKKNLFVSLF